MQTNDTQLIKDVDAKINKYKLEINELKEKSKKLETAAAVNENNINNTQAELLKLNPDLTDIIDDPVKLQEYADSIRADLEKWTTEEPEAELVVDADACAELMS